MLRSNPLSLSWSALGPLNPPCPLPLTSQSFKGSAVSVMSSGKPHQSQHPQIWSWGPVARP